MSAYKYTVLFLLMFAIYTVACTSGEETRSETIQDSDDIIVEDNGDSENRTDETDNEQDTEKPNGKDTTAEEGESDDPVDQETEEEVDTGDTIIDGEFPPCANYDYDKKSYNYGSDYAKGPYGFKGSMCWDFDAGEGSWTNYGDVIHNICLPNQDGEETCLGEFYNAGYNLLIIEVSAIDCPACAAESRDEARLVKKLSDNYWKPAWVTIMGRSLQGALPTLTTAASYKSQYKSSGPVLADTQGTWEQRMFLDKWPADDRAGVPLTFIVNPENMVIWDAFAGWTDAANYEEFAQYIVDLSVYCSSNDFR